MRCRAQLFQNLWRDDLVLAKLGTTVHDAVSDRHRVGIDMIAECCSECPQRITLGFVSLVTLQKRGSIRGANAQRSVVAPNALGTSNEQRLLVVNPVGFTSPVNAELQRRRTAVENEDGSVIINQLFLN